MKKVSLIAAALVLLVSAVTTASLEAKDKESPLTKEAAIADLFAMAEAAGPCEGGWTLQCVGNVCCTVCQSTGAVGGCGAVGAN